MKSIIFLIKVCAVTRFLFGLMRARTHKHAFLNKEKVFIRLICHEIFSFYDYSMLDDKLCCC